MMAYSTITSGDMNKAAGSYAKPAQDDVVKRK